MSMHRQLAGKARHDRDRFYPAPLPANPWVLPAVWLLVLVLAAIWWLS